MGVGREDARGGWASEAVLGQGGERGWECLGAREERDVTGRDVYTCREGRGRKGRLHVMEGT